MASQTHPNQEEVKLARQEIEEQRQRIEALEAEVTRLTDKLGEHRQQLSTLDAMKTLINVSQDMIQLVNVDGTIEYINDFILERIGAKRHEIIGLNLFEYLSRYLPAGLVEERKNMFYQAIETKQIINHFDQNTNADTAYYNTICPVLDSTTHEVAKVALYSRNLTDLHQREKALKLAQSINNTLLNTTNDVINLIKPDGTIIQVNEAFSRMRGTPKEQLEGGNLFDHFEEENVDERIADIKRVVATKKPYQKEDYFELVDMTFSTGIYPILNEEGEVHQIALYGRNITDIKKHELLVTQLRNQYKNIIDSLHSVIISVNHDLKLTNWNREAERLTGKTESDVVDLYYADVFPYLKPFARDIDQAVVQKNNLSFSKQKIAIDSNSRYFDIRVFPIFSDANAGATIQLEDITQKVVMENTLIQSEKMMLVGELSAGMAHELNNPLGGITQGLQTIIRRVSADIENNRKIAADLGLDLSKVNEYFVKRDIFRFFELMRDSSKRASDIITNMLQFSRKSGQGKTRESIADIIDQTLDLIKNDYHIKKQIDAHKIKFSRNVDADIPPVLCVKNEIQQVLLNLLKNASDAMFEAEKTDPVIQIIAYGDNNSVIIKVVDNGPGISSQHQSRIFEPFFTTKAVGKGTGLGLYITYMIITQNHNGTIEARNDEGGGSCFVISLPTG